MDADGEANLGPDRFDAGSLGRLFFVAGRQDDHRPLEPGVARPGNHGFEVGGEDLVGQVAVAVDHRAAVRCAACRRSNRTNAASRSCFSRVRVGGSTKACSIEFRTMRLRVA